MEHPEHHIKSAQATAPAPVLQSFTNTQFIAKVSDSNSGATMDIDCWLPDYESQTNPIPTGYYFLGNYAVPGGATPYQQMLYKAIAEDTKKPYFAPPTGFNCVWSKSHCELQVYNMTPPEGYVAIGCIVTGDNNYPNPDNVAFFNNLMCVRNDLCIQITTDNLIWDDHHSGANLSASVFLLPTSLTAIAVEYYPDPFQTMDINPAVVKS